MNSASSPAGQLRNLRTTRMKATIPWLLFAEPSRRLLVRLFLDACQERLGHECLVTFACFILFRCYYLFSCRYTFAAFCVVLVALHYPYLAIILFIRITLSIHTILSRLLSRLLCYTTMLVTTIILTLTTIYHSSAHSFESKIANYFVVQWY